MKVSTLLAVAARFAASRRSLPRSPRSARAATPRSDGRQPARARRRDVHAQRHVGQGHTQGREPGDAERVRHPRGRQRPGRERSFSDGRRQLARRRLGPGQAGRRREVVGSTSAAHPVRLEPLRADREQQPRRRVDPGHQEHRRRDAAPPTASTATCSARRTVPPRPAAATSSRATRRTSARGCELSDGVRGAARHESAVRCGCVWVAAPAHDRRVRGSSSARAASQVGSPICNVRSRSASSRCSCLAQRAEDPGARWRGAPRSARRSARGLAGSA